MEHAYCLQPLASFYIFVGQSQKSQLYGAQRISSAIPEGIWFLEHWNIPSCQCRLPCHIVFAVYVVSFQKFQNFVYFEKFFYASKSQCNGFSMYFTLLQKNDLALYLLVKCFILVNYLTSRFCCVAFVMSCCWNADMCSQNYRKVMKAERATLTLRRLSSKPRSFK